jgi:hypothetical protein
MHESFNRALVQLPGVLVRLPFGILYQEFEHSGRLRSLVVKYSRAQVVQISADGCVQRVAHNKAKVLPVAPYDA